MQVHLISFLSFFSTSLRFPFMAQWTSTFYFQIKLFFDFFPMINDQFGKKDVCVSGCPSARSEIKKEKRSISSHLEPVPRHLIQYTE